MPTSQLQALRFKAKPHRVVAAVSPTSLYVIFPKNAREYTKYSLRFLENLPDKSDRRYNNETLCGIALTKRQWRMYAAVFAIFY